MEDAIRQGGEPILLRDKAALNEEVVRMTCRLNGRGGHARGYGEAVREDILRRSS